MFDRAAILKSRTINRRKSVTDLTTASSSPRARRSCLKADQKKNPFKLKGRRKSVQFCTQVAETAASVGDSASIALIDGVTVGSSINKDENRPILEMIGFDGPVDDMIDFNTILQPIPSSSSNIVHKRPVPTLIPIKVVPKPTERFNVAKYILEKINEEYLLKKKKQPVDSVTNKIDWDECIGYLHYDSE